MFKLKLLSSWNPWLFVLLALFLTGSAWILYRREVRSLGLGPSGWIIPLLRSLAIFLITLTLAEPVIESRYREGEPGHVHFLVDGSTSMSIIDTLETSDSGNGADRFQRAVAALVTPNSGVCDQLSGRFDWSIWRADSQGNLMLWQSALQGYEELPQDHFRWSPPEWSAKTALGDSLNQLREQIIETPDANPTANAQSIIVLMSDGQNNFGRSLQSAADDLAKSNMQLIAVGFGPEHQPNDLVLKAFEAPQRLFKTDQLTGRIIVAEMLPPGSTYQVQLLLENEIVWQQSFQAKSEQQREIKFELSMNELHEIAVKKLPDHVHYNSLPIKLTAKLISSISEPSIENNQQDTYITVGASKAQILLIDGRSRWEIRYLRNLFARDPVWQTTSVIAEDGDTLKFPQTPAQWQALNLVVLGDVPASLWNTDLQAGLIDYVNRGGGLIICDGARQHLHTAEFTTLSTLSPVRLQTGELSATDAKWNPQLTLAGQRLSALNLTDGSSNLSIADNIEGRDRNSQFWRQLPKLNFVQPVSLAAGSETLVEVVYQGQSRPLLVGRRFGGGQVLYVASDETWRWRFKVADLVHQRLWNQLARWVMRKPMSVESEFLSLDTGAASHTSGTPIEIRAALRQTNGTPAEDRKTVAVISRYGELITRVNLQQDPLNPGAYSSFISELPAGEYQVSIEAEGFTKEALLAQSTFAVVQPSLNTEMIDISCDSQSLRKHSHATGGQYLHESQLEQLPDLLRPLSGGKIVHSTRLIWQSYYWFCTALFLLAVEWVLRKRAGLI